MARILIVEDDPGASEMIARICQFKGHEVRESRDPVQALAVAEQFAPEVLVTDLAMPLGGGLHLVRELRAKREHADCSVIVITGYASMLSAHERGQLEPCAILAKPLQLQPLLTALEDALASAQS